MTNTTATNRHDQVENEIADLVTLSFPAITLATWKNPGNSSSIKIPSVTNTVNADAVTTTTSAAAATKDELVIDINKTPGKNVLINLLEETQDINGNYLQLQISEGGAELLAHIDEEWLDYLAFGANVSSGSASTFNVAGDALATADWRNAMAYIQSQRGTRRSDLRLVIDPYAEGQIRTLGTFELDKTITGGSNKMGVEELGVLDGVPVVSSQGLPGSLNNRKTFAVSAFAAGGTSGAAAFLTGTVGVNHGLLAGMPYSLEVSTGTISGSGGTILGVNGTQVMLAHSGTSVVGSATGTVTLNAAVNLLFDMKHVFFAPQAWMVPKIVDTDNQHAKAVQLTCIYGRGARSGRVARILSPYSAMS